MRPGAEVTLLRRCEIAFPLVVLISLAVATAGCGGDDSDEGAEPTQTTADVSCLESWNDDAGESLKGIVSLSNDPKAGVAVGTYAGEPFSAEAFDNTTGGTGEDVEVQPGDCVISQFSSDFGMPLFVFVRSSDAGEWHRLSETGKHPLAEQAEPLLDDAEQVSVAEGGDLDVK